MATRLLRGARRGLAAGAALAVANATRDSSAAAESRPRPMMFVKDPDAFAKKWKKFSTDGIGKLVVIADFDFTLTTAFKPTGEPAISSQGILMRTDALDPQVQQIGWDLFHTYYPIEQSIHLSDEEKLPFMIEWWTQQHDTLVKYKLRKQHVLDAVEASDIALRHGFFEVVEVLAKQKVPTLVFSAGNYNVIHAILDKEFAKTSQKEVPENIHVVSNIMRYDENGTVIGFEGKLIHSLNKNAGVIADSTFWKQCQLGKRENILVLGDSIHDADMAQGLDLQDCQILRIGFLNDKVDERLKRYMERFDVVLTHDSSLLPVELLIHQIT